MLLPKLTNLRPNRAGGVLVLVADRFDRHDNITLQLNDAALDLVRHFIAPLLLMAQIAAINDQHGRVFCVIDRDAGRRFMLDDERNPTPLQRLVQIGQTLQ